MLTQLYQWLINLFAGKQPLPPKPLSSEDRQFLLDKVSFYRSLNDDDRLKFEARVLSFLQTTEVVGHDVEVTMQDKLLVAAGAVIPVWRFDGWHYFNLDTVSLVSGSFNEQSQFAERDSVIQGLVGNGHMSGKMILSQPALHYGFSNDQDKQNVAIHEFVHLLDMADGDCDGFPERLLSYAHCVPWLDLVERKTAEIFDGKSNIRDYAATNRVEFLAVVSEYFFERPAMLKNKHPEVYAVLEQFYQQQKLDLILSIKVAKKAPCPCGSGKRYKRCCLSESQ